MSETTRLPFDPIPVSGAGGTTTADPKPAFSRSVVDTGGLLPPVRKPVSALPSAIVPEAPPPEPNPMPGTPPPNPAAVGGFLRDLLKPTRGKGAVAAGLVSLFAGAYGLNLVMPIQTPSSKPRAAEPETAKGPAPSIDIERTSPRATEERSPVIQTGGTEPGKLPPLPPAEAVPPPSSGGFGGGRSEPLPPPGGFGGGRSDPLPPPGGFGTGRTETLPQPTDPRNGAGSGGWGSAGAKTEPTGGSGALPTLPPLPQENKTRAALPPPGGFGGVSADPPTKPALPQPTDNGFRPVGGTLPPPNEQKDNTVPPPGGGGGVTLPPLPKPGELPAIEKKPEATLPALPPADKTGAVAPPPATFGAAGTPLPKPDEGMPKPKPTTIEQPGAAKLPDLPAPGPTPVGTLPPPAPSLPAVPVGLNKKDDPPALPPPGETFAPAVRGATPAPSPAAVAEQPPKTDFDVDIVRVRSGDTYATISDKFYGSTRYAAALRAFNRGADLGQLREVQVPPLHVIRTQAGGRERDIETPSEPRGVVPAGGIRGPVLDAPVQSNTAPDAVDWGAPGKRR